MEDHIECSDVNARQLVLVKRSQRWVFRYCPGEETNVLQSLAEEAEDPTSNFDWFDAAVLSHQMGDKMARQLKNLMKG
jgi:hypothetical protein